MLSNDAEFVLLKNNECLKAGQPVKNDYYTLMLGLRGEMDVTVGYHRFTLAPGHMAIISPKQIFSVDRITPDFATQQLLFTQSFLYKSHIREQVIDELLYLHPEYPPVFELEDNALPGVHRKFKTLTEEYDGTRPFHFEVIRLVLTELLYDYNRACEYCLLRFRKNMNRQYQLTFQFKKLVEEQFLELRTIAEYAVLLGVTAKHLSETVKEETGKTALEIIHERLLLEMQYQLKYSALSVKEAAGYFKFDNASHFTRFFKLKTGLTPKEYRQLP